MRRFRLPLLLLGGVARARARRPPLRERDVSRLPVRKTYKLFIGGRFPRSESGRTYEAEGQNVARASRKDARDAVVAARKAQPGWAGATAYNRGQVLYRLAEMMETRAADLAAVCSGKKEVEAAIDRVVWYAGWADKLAQVLGSSNPVAGPYFNFTFPEPTGVVAILAPDEPALGGLVSRLAPALVGGNAVVVVASETHPLAAIELAEAIATSDVPGGVVNILTGQRDELAPILAGHMDVNALDLTGADGQLTRARAARRRQRQARRPRQRRRAEPVGDLELPRAEDRLASDRPVGRYTSPSYASRRYASSAAASRGERRKSLHACCSCQTAPSSQTQNVGRCDPSIGQGWKPAVVAVLRPDGLPELVVVAPRRDEEEVEALAAAVQDHEAEVVVEGDRAGVDGAAQGARARAPGSARARARRRARCRTT